MRYDFYVPSVSSQTGYKRPVKTAICQDHDFLPKINQFNFDINNLDFVRYFEGRTGWMISAIENKPLFLKNLFSGHPSEDVTRWKLQDCWELFVLDHSQALMVPGIKHK